MRIGIDIDGVISNEEQFIYLSGQRFCKNKGIKLKPISNKHYSIDVFQWSEDMDFLFWKENYLQYLTSCEYLMNDAVKYIKKLNDANHTIFILTDRTNRSFQQLGIHNDIEKITKEWLSKNFVTYNSIYFTVGRKLEYISKLKLDCMIDDDPNILNKSSTCLKICFRNNFNQNFEILNSVKVSSWKEIYRTVENHSLLPPAVS